MTRPDAITRAQMPPLSRENPLTPVIVGIIVVIIFLALLLLFTVVIPLTAEHGAEKRSDRFDFAVNNAVNSAMENVDKTGRCFKKNYLAQTDRRIQR